MYMSCRQIPTEKHMYSMCNIQYANKICTNVSTHVLTKSHLVYKVRQGGALSRASAPTGDEPLLLAFALNGDALEMSRLCSSLLLEVSRLCSTLPAGGDDLRSLARHFIHLPFVALLEMALAASRHFIHLPFATQTHPVA